MLLCRWLSQDTCLVILVFTGTGAVPSVDAGGQLAGWARCGPKLTAALHTQGQGRRTSVAVSERRRISVDGRANRRSRCTRAKA